MKGRHLQKICEQTSDPGWGENHWATLVHNYLRAPFFQLYRPVFEPLYRRPEPLLATVNFGFITAICGILGIAIRFVIACSAGPRWDAVRRHAAFVTDTVAVCSSRLTLQ